MPDIECEICEDEGWVCVTHPHIAWNNGEPMCCGGSAGIPCKCNKGDPPRNFHPDIDDE